MENDLLHGDCLELMKDIPDNSIDMILTSPPYDNIKNYNNNLHWDFNNTANEINRLLKSGGVNIWVVGDQTKKGSETGTSFKQALYFMELGLKLHDTMIYRKKNYTPLTHRRYEQEFEYMFCFVKGKISTFNPIMVPCKWAGTKTWGESTYYKSASDKLTHRPRKRIGSHKIKGNIFEYVVGSTKTGKIKHPAMFPLKLAEDQVGTWTNENDVVLDMFMGSGTTGIACKNLNRKFIGIEKDDKYFEIAKQRIKRHESNN